MLIKYKDMSTGLKIADDEKYGYMIDGETGEVLHTNDPKYVPVFVGTKKIYIEMPDPEPVKFEELLPGV